MLRKLKLNLSFNPSGMKLAKSSFLICRMVTFFFDVNRLKSLKKFCSTAPGLSTGLYFSLPHGSHSSNRHSLSYPLLSFGVQLHNLPVEFWDGETLETISSSLGRLLKIDDFYSFYVQVKIRPYLCGDRFIQTLEARFLAWG